MSYAELISFKKVQNLELFRIFYTPAASLTFFFIIASFFIDPKPHFSLILFC